MSLDDKTEFLHAMEENDVTPLTACSTNVYWAKTVPSSRRSRTDIRQLDNFLTTGFLDIVALDTPLFFYREGVQIGVQDKLRLGKYPREASLNLIRLTVEECRQHLFEFIRRSYADGKRNLLIIHGRGRNSQSHANIVRSYLARWLPEFEEIQAFCCAQPRHGGEGACYVALKKSPQAKLDNRERHATRRRI
ncbi:DNA endonuclease SmrA [Erwinia sp. HR93]|uniref:DNA endonuclease SmrA n=1 Tax=Erwinia sp. HR93 TaxID=3094840 RepID=UPI002ADEC26F|nr:DNA endonuclease SmrA [Erwinia sp. HR93]MEA1065063.1 DNA endonuclease SmrA [Erwinia sp. HR93]